ncbi:hypothetical protein [Fusibacter ferrireducens]|uniref:Uncharacterized protein n=1 Tax=Fusibacter ferrireducens TaxID=2785058 RepID=A0ABS0A020_9FIRM|nr:hypothetical protein [Fusibacter ferrireducens]MBF4696047.1 hypothetical protein [Fusibacter ferrireducens]
MSTFDTAIKDEIYGFYHENKISFKASDSLGDVLIDYFNVLSKRISKHKRCVHMSKELKNKIKNLEISKEHVNIINKFRVSFEQGKDMNGFLSRSIFRSDFYDKLLICWGIHHLHLSNVEATTNKEMKLNRSDVLLFCMVVGDDVYFIDVESHNKDYVFSMFKLLNIIHDNWQFLIDQYEVKDIIRGSLNLVVTCDRELHNLRKMNINIMYEIRGKVYFLIDKGLMGNGSSFGNSMRMTNVMHSVRCDTPQPPTYAQNIKFKLSGKINPLGTLYWTEGNQIKKLII